MFLTITVFNNTVQKFFAARLVVNPAAVELETPFPGIDRHTDRPFLKRENELLVRVLGHVDEVVRLLKTLL